MSKIYKATVDGREISYGARQTKSRFSEKEWDAISFAIASEEYPDVCVDAVNHRLAPQKVFDLVATKLILERKYEDLLELLPQSSFSKAGTHPQWIADEVERNTLRKDLTQDDITDLIASYSDGGDYNLSDIFLELQEYFEIDDSKIKKSSEKIVEQKEMDKIYDLSENLREKKEEWRINSLSKSDWSYTTSFNSKEEAIAEGLRIVSKYNSSDRGDDAFAELEDSMNINPYLLLDGEKILAFKVGQVKQPQLNINSESMLNDISDEVYSEYGDYAEAYLQNMEKTEIEELDKLIALWLERNKHLPPFFIIVNEEIINVDKNKEKESQKG